MLIPCIDLQGGQAVQLVHGRKRELAVADVLGLLEKFKAYEWLHVIDLDAAMGKKTNAKLVKELCREAGASYGMKVRVGGGIRSVARAVTVAGWNPAQLIIGSAAFRDGNPDRRFLERLTRKVAPAKIVIALDTLKGMITTQGWRRKLKMRPKEVMAQLAPFCAAFLCTDVDREGTMCGVNLAWFRSLREATSHPIIAAGGIKTRREVAVLEKMGMDAAAGMAMYKNILS
jgi:phosphoribosylformimino-5-aminoimidazole carboxamide ribonucleotide (ProFAR) isomerase